jgi:hypothetical protein
MERGHFAKGPNDSNSIESGHHEINDERIDLLPFEHFQTLYAISGEQNVKVRQTEQISRGATNFVVIVDDEYRAPSGRIVYVPMKVIHSGLFGTEWGDGKGLRRSLLGSRQAR